MRVTHEEAEMADDSETGIESGEEQIDEEGRNPTQQRMDEEGVEPAPVDASWTGEPEAAASTDAEVPGTSGPAEGSDPSRPVESADQGAPVAAAGPGVPGGSFETSAKAEGSDPSASAEAPAGPNEPIFEPDVPLAAEVNREAGGGPRKGVIAGVAGAFALLGAVLLRRRR